MSTTDYMSTSPVITAAWQAANHVGSDKSVKLPSQKPGDDASVISNNLVGALSGLEDFRKSGSESNFSSMKTSLEGTLGTKDGDAAADQLRNDLSKGDYDGMTQDLDSIFQKTGNSQHQSDATAFVNELRSDGAAAKISPATGSTGSTSGSSNQSNTGNSSSNGNEFGATKTYDWNKMAELYKQTGT